MRVRLETYAFAEERLAGNDGPGAGQPAAERALPAGPVPRLPDEKDIGIHPDVLGITFREPPDSELTPENIGLLFPKPRLYRFKISCPDSPADNIRGSGAIVIFIKVFSMSHRPPIRDRLRPRPGSDKVMTGAMYPV